MLRYLGLDPLLTQDQHYTLLKDTFSLTHMVHRCRLLAAIYKAMWATSRFSATLCLHFLCKILGKILLIWVSVVITLKYARYFCILGPSWKQSKETQLDEHDNTQCWRRGVVSSTRVLLQATRIILCQCAEVLVAALLASSYCQWQRYSGGGTATIGAEK